MLIVVLAAGAAAAGAGIAAVGAVLARGAGSAALATSVHADTAGIHVLSRVGVTGGIVASGHFYI